MSGKNVFSVIKGKKDINDKKVLDKRKKLQDIYYNSFVKNYDCLNINKALFNGIKYVKYVNLDAKMTYDELKEVYHNILMVKELMRYVCPYFFLLHFPIIKDYNGKKFEAKDFYSTMEYLSTINLEDPLLDNLEEFLWQYYNQDLMAFALREIMIVEKLRRFEGKEGIMEGFMHEMGVDSYSIDEKRKQIINNRTGKREKLKVSVPNYLKVVKNIKKED